MSVARATADVLKVAIKSTAATVRLISIAVVFAALLAALVWLAHGQGMALDNCGFSEQTFSCTMGPQPAPAVDRTLENPRR